MRRIALCLVLIAASPLAFARDARSSGAVGDCRDSVITVPSPAPAKHSANPVQKARPAAHAPTSGGGGDDPGAGAPRVPRWHSFLPGMFR